MVKIVDLEPRNNCIVKNKYIIENNYNNEFHLVIYYLNKNKLKLIIRNLDNVEGWEYDLTIKIYSLDYNNFEIISIGSSNYNSKIMNIFTDIHLVKLENYDQKIPKQIIQTSFSNEIDNIYHINSIYTFQELNPEYKYLFFDDKRCREYIKKKFDKYILNYYDKLIPGAFKADFFRYCFLYNEGGCYFDCKSILKIKLRDIIKEDDDLLLCKDHHKTGIYNAVILSSKKNDLFINCINKIINKINNFDDIYNINNKVEFNKLENILSLTGPDLLYEAYNEIINHKEFIKMNHIIKGNHSNYKNLLIEYNNNIFLYKSYKNYKSYGIHYSQLWKNNEIIYKNVLYLNNYKILYKEYMNNIKFKFYLLNKHTIILENRNIINNKIIKKYNRKIELKIIDRSSNLYKLKIINENIKYQIINLNTELEELDYIKNINLSINRSNIELGICKMENKYFLVIFNKLEKEIDEFELIIELKNNNKIYQKINNLRDIIIRALDNNVF